MLGLWTYVALPVAVVNWFITLVRGRPSAGVHAWTSRLVRYQAHVYAYVYLVADPYPSFRGWAGTYPIDVAIAPLGAQARWKTRFRIVLALPAYVLATVLVYVLYIVAFLGAFAALATGRFPRGFRDLSAYCLRYQAQTYAYLLLLTDRYPTLPPRRARRARRRARPARRRARAASRCAPRGARRANGRPGARAPRRATP